VLRGVTHGAVDYLIKPVRIEELRNVWQHVARRRIEAEQVCESVEASVCAKKRVAARGAALH